MRRGGTAVSQTLHAPGMGAGARPSRTGSAASAAAALRAYLATGDPAARDDLVEHYLPLVITIARRYENCGEPLEDLVQVGAIGLIHAIDRFDPARGTQLSSFAIPTIEGEIRRELRDRSGTIRLPRSVQEARSSVLHKRDELAAQLGRAPTDEELGAALGLPPEAVAAALQAGSAMAPASLTENGNGASGEPGAVDDHLGESEDRALLAGGFATLDERERRVLHLRFFGGLSQTQIAAQVGVSQAHISRIIRDALAKLRDQLGEGSAGAAAKTPDTTAISPAPAPVSRREAGAGRQDLASERSVPTIASMASPPARSLDEYIDLPYHLTIARDDAASGDEAWVATVEELDGCEARGSTPEVAVANVRQALESWIALALARGQAVPAPRAAATHSGRLLLRMEPSLHAELAHAAEREDVSLNQFVSNALAGAVRWRGTVGSGRDQPGAPAAAAARTWTPGLVVNAVDRRARRDHRDRVADHRAHELARALTTPRGRRPRRTRPWRRCCPRRRPRPSPAAVAASSVRARTRRPLRRAGPGPPSSQ